MLLRSGIIVAFFTLLSRLFGLARELFIAAMFGSSSIADCVNVAFKFPNLFRRTFGEGALSSVFIPIFSKKLVESKDEALIFSGKIFTLLLLVLVVLTIFLQITMPYLMTLIAPGFSHNSEKFDLTVTLCRITIPYIIFVSVTALFGGMLNSVKQFAAFAFAPIIMSLCIITITPLIQKEYDTHFGIAYALIISGILQVIFMYFCLVKAGFNFPLLFCIKDKDVSTLLKKMLPATMSSGVQQLNLFVSQSIASFLPGAISILSYADRLYQLPMSIIGVTFGTILLPELSQIYKQKDYSKANELQNKAIKISAMISIPAMCGLIMLSSPIIHLIYERGRFTALDTIETSNVLSFFALGLPAIILSKILTPIFYANLDTKTPFKITIYSILMNVILNIILMLQCGIIGIALGSSIAAYFNAYLLNKHAQKYGKFKIDNTTQLFIIKIIISSIFMSFFIAVIRYNFDHLFYMDHLTLKSMTLFATIAASSIILAISYYFLRVF